MAVDDVEAFCRALWRHEEAILEALNARVDPNGRDRWGNTPLLMAAQYGDLAIVQGLVRRGATVDQQRTHLTPITYAARRKARDIVDFLRGQGARESIVTAVHLDDRKGVAQALKREPDLATLRDEQKTPILHHAAEAQDAAMITLLLEHGASVGAGDDNGETALHRLADLRSVASAAAAAVASLLLDRGADVNARNWDGVTPLHQAARARNVAVAEVLLARGADANARDKGRGSTPLRRAIATSGAGGTAGTGEKMLPLARLLLDHGADPDAQDKRGIPVHESARDPELRALLLGYRHTGQGGPAKKPGPAGAKKKR